jgi:hypothetical protein
MQILPLGIDGDVNFAKARNDWIQETMFILDHDEESRIVTEQLDAPTQGTLGVNGQTVGVKEDNRLESDVMRATLDVGFSKEFEFFANELDALAVCAVDKHDIRLDSRFLMIVDHVDEIVDEGPLARAMCSVKQEVGDAIVAVKPFEFSFNGQVHLAKKVTRL